MYRISPWCESDRQWDGETKCPLSGVLSMESVLTTHHGPIKAGGWVNKTYHFNAFFKVQFYFFFSPGICHLHLFISTYIILCKYVCLSVSVEHTIKDTSACICLHGALALLKSYKGSKGHCMIIENEHMKTQKYWTLNWIMLGYSISDCSSWVFGRTLSPYTVIKW